MHSALRVAVVLAALFTFVSESGAQASAPPAERVDRVDKPGKPAKVRLAPEAVFAGIDLDPAKREQGKALAITSRAQFSAILARQTPGHALSAADRAALKSIGEAHNAAYRALLTEAQRQRLDANLAALRPAKPAQPTAVTGSSTGGAK